jgi:SAM-dependent methyltransferase
MAAAAPPSAQPEVPGLLQGEAVQFRSKFLKGKLTVLPGVFIPKEAELRVLPLMHDYPAFFVNKRVLEIGTGSGIIALYAAQLGASMVVATDISEVALACTAQNAKTLGLSARVETRLVPLDDMSAYSVIKPDEQFDLIISNPPYALDMDVKVTTAVTDSGVLGFSLVRGLNQHLAPGGAAMLLYGSLFYHQVMVKFARHEGYDVRSHPPAVLINWEAETLFNYYLADYLRKEGLPSDIFRFHRGKDFQEIVVRNEYPPLFADESGAVYRGMILIRRPTQTQPSNADHSPNREGGTPPGPRSEPSLPRR